MSCRVVIGYIGQAAAYYTSHGYMAAVHVSETTATEPVHKIERQRDAYGRMDGDICTKRA
jgi:hypothetical protein